MRIAYICKEVTGAIVDKVSMVMELKIAKVSR